MMKRILIALLLPSLALAASGKRVGVNPAPQISGNGSSVSVTATGGATKTLADWQANGPVKADATTVTATGSTTARTLADWQATAMHAGDTIINVKAPPYNAKGDGVTDDTAAIQAALSSGGLIVDGARRAYKITGANGLSVPAGVTLRNALFVVGTAGMKAINVNTGSRVLNVKVTGTGIAGNGETGVYPAADGVSDVVLDVELANISIGVQIVPTVNTVPARWTGTVYAHDIPGNVSGTGYGVLLNGESCRLFVRGASIGRHAVYLTGAASAAARWNDVQVDVNGSGNAAVQLYATAAQLAVYGNTVRGKIRGVTGYDGVRLIGNVQQNTVSVDVDGGGTAASAVYVEGETTAGNPATAGNKIQGCTVRGAFTGQDAITDNNGEGTLISGNDVRGYGTVSAIALRSAGTLIPVTGPSVLGNTINLQGQALVGIADVQTTAPTYVGPNDVRNNGAGLRVRDIDSGVKRRGFSREFVGQVTTGSLASNATGFVDVTFPDAVANARVSTTVSNMGVTEVGNYPSYANRVTTTTARIYGINGSAGAQTLTIDYVVRGD